MADRPKPTPKKDNALARIKSGAMSRGFALARVAMSAGARAAGTAMGSVFSDEETKSARLKALVTSQIGLLTQQLGQLKGTAMKVGQMLSIVGDQFLPPEAVQILKTLQSQSPPVQWKEMEKVLKRQLGPEKLALVEIDPEPMAAASLGQVHRARRKSDGRALAMKIQYPGVDAAIDSDLKAIRSIFAVVNLLPGGDFDPVFDELRTMLKQEVDYKKELAATDEFREALESDPRYVVPETVPELSAGRVLTTTLEEGVPIDAPEVKALSQERRDALGRAFLDLYLRELLVLHMMQTDPHFGNYRVRLGAEGQPDRLVLLDFGAVRHFSPDFMASYVAMVRGAFEKDRAGLERGASSLNFLRDEDSPELRDTFVKLCTLFMEPFASPTPYDWAASDLPKRIAAQAARLGFGYKLRTPPREIIFLDRKAAGVFFFLAALRARFDARDALARHLDAFGASS